MIKLLNGYEKMYCNILLGKITREHKFDMVKEQSRPRPPYLHWILGEERLIRAP